MDINEILNGNVTVCSPEEQIEVLNQMKETKKVFDLNENERKNLIDFLCEKSDNDAAIDYLFHVLDTEISYPIDDEKVKILFSDERMKKMKDLMMNQLQDDDVTEEKEN